MEVVIDEKPKRKWWVSLIAIAVVAGVCVSVYFLIKNNYYTKFVVNQSSMKPTLSGDPFNASYGISDKHASTIRAVKRYQIVTTYFPEDYDGNNKLKEGASLKIKRVLALPGERFKIEDYKVVTYNYTTSSWNDPFPIPFDITQIDQVISKPHRYYPDTTLKSDEYFLCGDNRDVSYDSSSVGPIPFTCLQGVVVKVLGHRRIDEDGKEYFVDDDDRSFPGVDY